MPCCNHFFLGQLTRRAYVDEFVYNYGEWNRALAANCGASAPAPAPTIATFAIRC